MTKKIGVVRCIFYVCIAMICATDTFASTPSPTAKFSLLTCSPGPDLYSVFGHSAIRFQDTLDGKMIDWVYNYGTFTFNDDFYWKFTMGQLDYKLSKNDFFEFQYEYIETGRGIWEQTLNLTLEENEKLFELLEENYKPENRTYRYDFFYDNCSSRIRDIIQQALNNEINFSYRPADSFTYRQAIQNYLVYMPWSDFGIDLALGMPADKTMEPGGDMFLPDSLMMEFDYALYHGNELTSAKAEILPQEFELSRTGFITPLNVFFLFLILQVVIGLYFLKKFKYYLLPDRLLFFISGLVGLLVTFLWFFTDHNATVWNLNILWANPINLWMAFACLKKKWHRTYITIYSFALLALIAGWFFWPQQFHLACMPIALGLLFVCLKIMRPRMLGVKTSA